MLGVPCVLGRTGVLDVVEMSLSADELIALQEAAKAVRARLERDS